jgi:hypothetical protein
LDGTRVVAVLELLSPTNKGSRADFDSFRDRRRQLPGCAS